ncbi:class I SAM-dependent methyltransferase [Arcobacter sp.]|uniref:class I SAM-dependent methyltransferase n=1 Tax=Arcobacter sp. TaxID=1872629 RepID=UPI003D09B5BA
MNNTNVIKYSEEINFWINEIKNYEKWFNGEIKEHYKTPSPKDNEKIIARNIKDSAILTWLEKHQKVKYLHDLKLSQSDFKNLKVLDLGSGPFPNALALTEIKELYALDPLLSDYIKAGFPIHYEDKVKFVSSYAEEMPFEDNFFDVILTLNAIDHFDNLIQTSKEIQRVLKPNGFFIAHVHYHKATITEPLEINDNIFKEAFEWCSNLKKIYEKKNKFGHQCDESESYALWSNYHL